MRAFASLALLATVATTFAQAGPPPGAPGSGGPGNGGTGGPFGNAPQGGRATNPSAVQVQTPTTETVRLLTLRSVQTDLGLKLAQYDALTTVVRSMGNVTSEETAFAAVSRALSATQAQRLQALLVQDLGYNALALSTVRAALSLTADQTTLISNLLATVETAKRAAATAADPRVAQRAMANLSAQSSAALAKTLTEEQDAKLHSLAGKALGSR